MPSKVRFAFTPRRPDLHLVAAALIVTMVLLSRRQLQVSNEQHFSLQNFGSVLKWCAFSVFVLVMGVRGLRDAVRKYAGQVTPGRADAELDAMTPAPPVYRHYVMPQLQNTAQEPVDEHPAAHDAYLSQLVANDAAHGANEANHEAAVGAITTTTHAATNGRSA